MYSSDASTVAPSCAAEEESSPAADLRAAALTNAIICSTPDTPAAKLTRTSRRKSDVSREATGGIDPQAVLHPFRAATKDTQPADKYEDDGSLNHPAGSGAKQGLGSDTFRLPVNSDQPRLSGKSPRQVSSSNLTSSPPLKSSKRGPSLLDNDRDEADAIARERSCPPSENDLRAHVAPECDDEQLHKVKDSPAKSPVEKKLKVTGLSRRAQGKRKTSTSGGIQKRKQTKRRRHLQHLSIVKNEPSGPANDVQPAVGQTGSDVMFQQERLPPISKILSSPVDNFQFSREKWSLTALPAAVGSESQTKPLPPVSQLCENNALPLSNLEAAARDIRHRKSLSAATSICNHRRHCKALTQVECPGDQPSAITTKVVNTKEALQSQNARLVREVISLRGELVLAYSHRGTPPGRVIPHEEVIDSKSQLLDGCATLPCVLSAITLTHMASQLASVCLPPLPTEVTWSMPFPVTLSPVVKCLREGFNFICDQMRVPVTTRGVQVISRVFKDVHLRLSEDLFAKLKNDTRANEKVRPAMECLLFQVRQVFESFLTPNGTSHVSWTRAFCRVVVRPLADSLRPVSAFFSDEVENLATGVLAQVAAMLRDGEVDKPNVSITSLCRALELSMAIALTLPASASKMINEDIYTIGRHNNVFGHYVFCLDSAQHDKNETKPEHLRSLRVGRAD